VRALTAYGQAAAVTQTTVATEVHKALDVHRSLTTEITLDAIVAIDCFADLKDFSVRQLMNALLSRNTDLCNDFLREFRANPVDIGQGDNNALSRWDVDASDTCHVYSPCVPVAIRQVVLSFERHDCRQFKIRVRHKLKRPNSDFPSLKENPRQSLGLSRVGAV
jgi:hypothetical protein